MHAGIANPRFPLKSVGGKNIPGACAMRKFTYLVRGPCHWILPNHRSKQHNALNPVRIKRRTHTTLWDYAVQILISSTNMIKNQFLTYKTSAFTETTECLSAQSPLTHWGRDKIDAYLQTTFSNAVSWMKMLEFRLKFHWSLFRKVQLTIFQHWCR